MIHNKASDYLSQLSIVRPDLSVTYHICAQPEMTLIYELQAGLSQALLSRNGFLLLVLQPIA